MRAAILSTCLGLAAAACTSFEDPAYVPTDSDARQLVALCEELDGGVRGDRSVCEPLVGLMQAFGSTCSGFEEAKASFERYLVDGDDTVDDCDDA